MSRVSKGCRRKKCKAPEPAAAAEPGPRFSRPWMAGLLEDALSKADLVGASSRAGVSMLEIVSARGRDPAFDSAMVEVDQVLRLAARANVLASAAGGSLGAIRALTNGTVSELIDDSRPEPPARGTARLPCPACGHRLLVSTDGSRGWVEVVLLDLDAAFPKDGSGPRELVTRSHPDSPDPCDFLRHLNESS